MLVHKFNLALTVKPGETWVNIGNDSKIICFFFWCCSVGKGIYISTPWVCYPQALLSSCNFSAVFLFIFTSNWSKTNSLSKYLRYWLPFLWEEDFSFSLSFTNHHRAHTKSKHSLITAKVKQICCWLDVRYRLHLQHTRLMATKPHIQQLGDCWEPSTSIWI